MDPIRNILEILKTRLNEELRNLSQRPDDWVTLTSIVNHDGNINQECLDKVVLSIYNIVRENVISTYNPSIPAGGQYVTVQPPIYIDLHVMFMANFSGANYAEGLSAISRVIGYFQQQPVLTHDIAPQLSPNVDKIVLEMENLSAVDVNYIMGMMGTKYLPSVFYKLRMVPYASNAMSASVYPARRGSITGIPSEESAG